MVRVRCSICRKHFLNIKRLRKHYLLGHSKYNIVHKLLNASIIQSVPKAFIKKRMKTRKECVNNPTGTNVINMSDFLVTYNDTVINISNKTNSIELQLSIEQDNNNNPSVVSNDKNIIATRSKTKEMARLQETANEKPILKPYRINVTKLHENLSLNHCSGTFYVCHCRDNCPETVTSSDTESTSESPPEFIMNCVECVRQFRSQVEYDEHMREYHSCRGCQEVFPTKALLQEHVFSHIVRLYVCYICNEECFHKEVLKRHLDRHLFDSTLETVLDLENDYRVQRYNFTSNTGYMESLNNIMFYLGDGQDFHQHHQKYQKIICEICYQEMFASDYLQHLQIMHCSMGH